LRAAEIPAGGRGLCDVNTPVPFFCKSFITYNSHFFLFFSQSQKASYKRLSEIEYLSRELTARLRRERAEYGLSLPPSGTADTGGPNLLTLQVHFRIIIERSSRSSSSSITSTSTSTSTSCSNTTTTTTTTSINNNPEMYLQCEKVWAAGIGRSRRGQAESVLGPLY